MKGSFMKKDTLFYLILTNIFIILILFFTEWILADYQARMIEHNNHYACVYGHSECQEAK